jgi:hypothetical protein
MEQEAGNAFFSCSIPFFGNYFANAEANAGYAAQAS